MKQRFLALLFCSVPALLSAEVVDSSPHGFTVHHKQTVSASPEEVYRQLIQWGEWWSGDHSYSGDAGNFYLEPRANGCWCESLPNGGSVLHLLVVYIEPGKMIRLRGGLGPLQGMAVNGALTIALREENGNTTIELTYAVGGYYPGGLESLASVVDGVLGEQVSSLAEKFE